MEYKNVPNVRNNFKPATEHSILNLKGLDGLVKAHKAAIPRTPALTESRYKSNFIGLHSEITDAQRDTGFFCIKTDGTIGVNNKTPFDTLIKTISGAMQDANTMASVLAKENISVYNDTPGLIFTDSKGNKLVYFGSGIGTVSETVVLVSELHTVYNQIKGKIRVSVAENQALALASLARTIGSESFLGSELLSTLNKEEYHLVPSYILGWCLNPNGSKNQSLAAQRSYESALFQSPDELDTVSLYSTHTNGSSSFLQLADSLDLLRDKFIADKLLMKI